ncbi:MAG TPA: ATP-dependent DNA helicase RecG [Gaiellaceae bacterium]|jgi:ATP-dependent DNA helicase RecG|nr:ATP-dependent DNA helicase RecG [Gaiellaceae bacterium]
MHAGFTGVVQHDWPRPRGWTPPQRLDSLDVLTLPGVGATLAKRLRTFGIRSVRDLLFHAPRRYESAVDQVPIAKLGLTEGEVAIEGRIVSARARPLRGRRTLVTAIVRDDSGGQVSASFFNQPWLAEKLTAGTSVRLRGKLGRYGFDVKSYDLGEARRTADYAPVYPASEQIPSTRLRELVRTALALNGSSFPDPLPAEYELPLRCDALAAIHFPVDERQAEQARRRLALDELVALQLIVARLRDTDAVAPSLSQPGELIARYRGVLPFQLTEHQERAITEIDLDLAQTTPMQRLLQGDVGSGKTVVALYALLRAVESSRQGALMAPTETLAEQHFLTLEPLCAQLGVRCVLLTGSVGSKKIRDELANGVAQIAVGTHALIQRDVEFADLAVAVVDEQHRFGVEQRTALAENRSTHVLHMTATPIPRTLALTIYGDLAVSEIAKPPANRRPIITARVGAERSSEAYKRLRVHLDAGRQAYVVCPLIELSETRLARAAEAEAERLQRAELRGYRVGLLHGRLKTAERREVMRRFKDHELDVLVATTVIEVGVDVPNATIMIVQEADRFGLAQLHQLRGRVGRGGEQSYCLLISRPGDELTETAERRLQALVDTTDGFELAEIDLDLRREGQLLGTRQSGWSDLQFTKLRPDRDLIERAREIAGELRGEDGPWQDEADRMSSDADHRGLA